MFLQVTMQILLMLFRLRVDCSIFLEKKKTDRQTDRNVITAQTNKVGQISILGN